MSDAAMTGPAAVSDAVGGGDTGSVRGLRGRLRRERRPATWKTFLRDLVVIIVAAVVISALIKAFLFRSFFIPSDSMNPTLVRDDRVIVNELQPKVFPLQRGDIVVFRDPGGWLRDSDTSVSQRPDPTWLDWTLSVVGLTAPDSDDHLIKRVIGLPGDHVTCCTGAGQIEINGQPIDDAFVNKQLGADSGTPFDVVVPKDSLWVMGDNRGNSQDSRAHLETPSGGFVPYSDVVGRAFVLSWPTSRWGWLDNHPESFSEVDRRDQG
jgi:signal peptidase I